MLEGHRLQETRWHRFRHHCIWVRPGSGCLDAGPTRPARTPL